MKDDKYYMFIALKEAEKAAAIDEVPVGALIVKDGKIIARAHNQREKGTTQQDTLKYLRSERLAEK